jgi:hypothetical protein
MSVISFARIERPQRGGSLKYKGIAVAACAVALGSAIATPAHAAPPPPDAASDAWSAGLSTVDSDDVNVAYVGGALRLANVNQKPASQRGATPEGMLVLPPHDLANPATRVTAAAAGAVGAEVEIRPWIAGEWGEWREAGVVLPAATTEVQVRIVLSGAGAQLSGLKLAGDALVAPKSSLFDATAGLTYRVYATREGLVGGTTSNGHVIVSRDHFVALPSRRGLAPKNTGDYTVRVCTTSGARCEFAPVWDVGPWNTTDDYWNPPETRQKWTDLAQGTPEAQAAYLNGYNGGKDGSGRKVSNPAGIDLADGTFWDGLKLTDNGYVNVSYIWTGTGPRGKIGAVSLNIRQGPTSTATSIGFAENYAQLPIECWVHGQSVAGPGSTTDRWDQIGTGQYVSHAYVLSTTGGDADECTA